MGKRERGVDIEGSGERGVEEDRGKWAVGRGSGHCGEGSGHWAVRSGQ